MMRLHENPRPNTSRHRLTLYCRFESDSPDHLNYGILFEKPTMKECVAEARSKGWRYYYANNLATCPACSKALVDLGK